MKKIFLILLLPTILMAQGSSNGMASLKSPANAYVAATGESFIADTSNLDLIFLNPASNANNNSYGILFSHNNIFYDVNTNILSVTAPLNYGSLAFSASNTSVDDIEYRKIPGEPIGYFTAQFVFLQLTYGMAIDENIFAGVSTKYIYEKIFIDEASGYGFDFGLIYNYNKSLLIGISATNIGKVSAFIKEKSDLPAQLKLGCTYNFDFEIIKLKTAVAYSSDIKSHFSVGVDAEYKNQFSVLAGYKTGFEYQGISIGLKIKYNNFHLCYAIIPSSYGFENSHLITIGYNF